MVTGVVTSAPRYGASFLSRIGFSIPNAHRFSSNVALITHALALSADQFYARKGTYENVHSVRIELTKLVLVGTRITCQATRDAGSYTSAQLLQAPAVHLFTYSSIVYTSRRH